jgi:methionyl-tRNA formyltransferase
MPADTSLAGLGPVVDELAAELVPAALRRVLAGDRGEPQTETYATYAPPFDADYAELDRVRPRAELERQVRAWATMFRPVVVGPVATVGAVRYRVLAASLADPADPAALRLEAADGPLWLTRVERLDG